MYYYITVFFCQLSEKRWCWGWLFLLLLSLSHTRWLLHQRYIICSCYGYCSSSGCSCSENRPFFCLRSFLLPLLLLFPAVWPSFRCSEKEKAGQMEPPEVHPTVLSRGCCVHVPILPGSAAIQALFRTATRALCGLWCSAWVVSGAAGSKLTTSLRRLRS